MNMLLAILLLATAGQCLAANYGVQWSNSPNATTLQLACNDTVTLTWQGTHSVAKAETGNCPSTGFQLLVNATTGGTYKYTMGPDDPAIFYFFCAVDLHCASGQIVQINNTCSTPHLQISNQTAANSTKNSTVVAASPDVVVMDAIYNLPSGRRQFFTRWRTGRIIPQALMKCGDELVFTWKSTIISHGVLLKPYAPYATGNMTCEDKVANGKEKVELIAPVYTATYTWTPTENGDYIMLCQVGVHCYNGQWLRASVRGCANDSLVYKPFDDNTSAPAQARLSPAPQPARSSSSTCRCAPGCQVLLLLAYLAWQLLSRGALHA